MDKNNNSSDEKSREHEKLALHLKYIISIAIVICCISVGSLFLEDSKVITTLSNASVLLSIVLAIIAILISLWDVAGQRNTLFDVLKRESPICN